MDAQADELPVTDIVFFHPEVLPAAQITNPAWYHHGYRIWVVHAYYHLREQGFPCRVTQNFPDSGIVVGFRTTLPRSARPTNERFLVCIQADNTPFKYSNLDIVQNPTQEGVRGGKLKLFLPHFPQIGLIPRDPIRGERFRRIGYFGNLYGVNRSPVFESLDFRQWMLENGFELVVKDQPGQWHDYSDIDAVVAIRAFSSRHNHKPATKLTNAWTAGVPAILGPESAYRALRRSDIDYIEVSSLEESKKALLRLRDNPDLRRKMQANASLRAEEHSLQSVVRAWMDLLDGPVRCQAERWFGSARFRNKYIWTRVLGGSAIDHAECIVQQRGPRGALAHVIKRPFELTYHALERRNAK